MRTSNDAEIFSLPRGRFLLQPFDLPSSQEDSERGRRLARSSTFKTRGLAKGSLMRLPCSRHWLRTFLKPSGGQGKPSPQENRRQTSTFFLDESFESVLTYIFPFLRPLAYQSSAYDLLTKNWRSQFLLGRPDGIPVDRPKFCKPLIPELQLQSS
jgi:hypothetical protein